MAQFPEGDVTGNAEEDQTIEETQVVESLGETAVVLVNLREGTSENVVRVHENHPTIDLGRE